MTQQGWVKLHRKILEDELWIDCTPEQKVIMMTLLMLANHDDKSWIWKNKKSLSGTALNDQRNVVSNE